MECISVFDMLKIGVGPSSSHTLGPWRAAERWIKELKATGDFDLVTKIRVDLYGSLSLTGKGHATDLAIMLGLSGCNPETIPVEDITSIIDYIKANNSIKFNNEFQLEFNPKTDIVFNRKFLPFHSNGMVFTATINGKNRKSTFYSIGGGFVVKEERKNAKRNKEIFKSFPYPIKLGTELLSYCKTLNLDISDVVLENEKSIRSTETIDFELERIWNTMLECMFIGCHTEGKLPGGLNVKRRASDINKRLLGKTDYHDYHDWIDTIQDLDCSFQQIMKWISCFAMAVNEENAGFGRVVTSPTNGAAGVIPAVLHYYICFAKEQATKSDIINFL